MKKRIKPKISIFCFGTLLLLTPVLLATSCTSKTENKIDNKQTPIIKKPESAKVAAKTKGSDPKPATPTVITPISPELTKEKVIELGWNKVASLTKEMFQKNTPGITHIGEEAFASSELTSLEIPDSVISIGKSAFKSSKLTSLEIPDSVISIGDLAFFYNLITKLKIGNGTKWIGHKSFYDCPIESLVLGRSLVTIDKQAFKGNRIAENTLIIPDSVTSIESNAFSTNTGPLKVLKLPTKFDTAQEKTRIGVA